ncbi:MAG: response regulator [Syntrophales bacterium]|nr:response regulator [Syntrophales bacterium]
MIVVVVDDEEGVRRSLKKVLQQDGYEVLLAEDGEKAIRIVEEDRNEIEIVISDYKMPGIDGLETLIIIGRLNPEIARIILTGYATMESAIEAVNAGIDGFLTKPFDNRELCVKVKEYYLKKRLKQFVSEPVFKALQREGAAIKPRKLEVTVLFCDIRDFTSLAEELEPKELSDLLNMYYFAPLDRIVYDHRGTLDKHIGDSIMVIFGAPREEPDDALRAVKAAVRMIEEVERVNEKISIRGKKISIGIGISTGEVMAGMFGSHLKKEYTVFGKTVNMASRLEHLAKGGQILICDRTFEKVREMVKAKSVEIPEVKGFRRSIVAYEVVGLNA